MIGVALCFAVTGCGGSAPHTSTPHDSDSASSVAVELGHGGRGEKPPSASQLSRGRVVDPKKVVKAIESAGFQITLRAGPTPSHFARAVYGTARDARTQRELRILPDGRDQRS
jgi:hypothetical protein